MPQFYLSLIFLGIVLIIVSLVLIVIDRKKSYEYIEDINAKKQELSQIVIDAEQMIQELNKFSDYVVTRIDEKNEELSSNLKNLDQKINHLNTVNANEQIKEDDGNSIRYNIAEPEKQFDMKKTLVADNQAFYNAVEENKSQEKNIKGKEKYSSLSQKHKEIIRLSESGLSDVEIARKLNLGKGEVQLILGLNK